MNFTTNERGGADGFCLIKNVEKKTSSKGGPYLDMTLSDATGEINAKLWDYNEMLHGTYEVGDLVKVRGVISKYNGADQMKIEKIRKATESDEIDPGDFVEQASETGEKMFGELIKLAEEFDNEAIRALTLKIYNDNKERLLYWPAAFKLHHAIRSGLLMHTLSIVRMCENVAAIYPSVNRDLLICGAMLHDIGKLREFDVNTLGTANGYTTEGNLIGHLVKGAMMVEKAAEELGTDDKIAMMIEHMIISHHGEPEFGAAVRPSFIEAEILSSLDKLDAAIYEMEDAVKSTAPEDFSARLWALDNRKLYNHALGEVTTDVHLF